MVDNDLSSYKPLFLKSAFGCLDYLKANISKVNTDTFIQKEILRMYHTLKSQNLFMGYMSAGNYCLLLEKVMFQVVNDQLTIDETLFKKLSDSVLLLQQFLNQIEKENIEIDLQEATSDLEVYIKT